MYDLKSETIAVNNIILSKLKLSEQIKRANSQLKVKRKRLDHKIKI